MYIITKDVPSNVDEREREGELQLGFDEYRHSKVDKPINHNECKQIYS